MADDGSKDPVGSNSSRWRIDHIPCASDGQVQGNPLALVGALMFVAGIIVPFMIKGHDSLKMWLFFSGIAGWVVALFTVWLQAKLERKKWLKVTARCLDREWHELYVRRGKTWAFRILCEFSIDGKTYRVTPVYWTTFLTENSLKAFLEKAVRPDGYCELYVNPRDPLQVELVGRDIKDLLVN